MDFRVSAETAELPIVPARRSRRLRGRRRRLLDGFRSVSTTKTTIVVAVLLAVVTPIAAWMNSRGQTPVYAARAEVLANNTSDAPNAAQFEAAVATQRVVMESRAVLEPVAEAHDLNVADLEEALTVDALTGSTVLQVTVEDEDAQLALAIIDSLVAQYVQQAPTSTSEEASELLELELQRLEAERTVVERELQAVEEINAAAEGVEGATSNPTRARRLSSESDELLRRIGNIEEQLNDIAIANLAPVTNSVVSPPFVLPDPVSPNPVQAAALGMFVGLALSGSLVLVRAQFIATRKNAEIPTYDLEL